MIPLMKPVITEDMKRAVLDVLESSSFILGENVEKFENEFAKYCGVEYSVGVGSGTSALHLALLACGIGKGDEVITVSNTFIATAFAVSFTGARPVFVDIDRDTYTIDASLVEEKINEKTRAIIPVHLYGHSCEMEQINEIADKHDLHVIEDACQAHGAEYGNKKTGSLGDLACFSFYPSKNMTAAGDGGIVVTNDEGLHEKLCLLRDYGQKEKNVHQMIGYNSRLSEISASICREQLKKLDTWNGARRKNAKYYTSLLEGVVATPLEKWGKHVYYLYVIRTKNRDGLKDFLSEKDITSQVHYPLPIYKQSCYNMEYRCPVTEEYSSEILSLPMYPELGKSDIEEVAGAVEEFC